MIIRSIVHDDLPAVVALLQEFASFEGLAEQCETTAEKLGSVMFGPGAFVEGLILMINDLPVGYALFYPHFSSFRGQPGIYLEDIYIRDEYRGRGIGKAVLKEIAANATARGFERIDFQVLSSNVSAIAFYENLGAVPNADERHFKFTDQAFASLVERSA